MSFQYEVLPDSCALIGDNLTCAAFERSTRLKKRFAAASPRNIFVIASRGKPDSGFAARFHDMGVDVLLRPFDKARYLINSDTYSSILFF